MKLLYTYLFIAILTFGASWNHNPVMPDSKIKPNEAKAQNACDAFACSIFWPLYWSYRIFAAIEPTKEGVKLEVGS